MLDKFKDKSELVLLGMVGLSDCIAYVSSAIILTYFKGKFVLTGFFGVAFIGGIFLAFKDYGDQATLSISFYFAYFCARMGVSGAYNTIYCIHKSLFPPLFATSSFGYCQIVAMAGTICCAYTSNKVNLNFAMAVYALLALIASILSIFLRHMPKELNTKK